MFVAMIVVYSLRLCNGDRHEVVLLLGVGGLAHFQNASAKHTCRPFFAASPVHRDKINRLYEQNHTLCFSQ